MKLVIVESPAKAQTINKYLGSDYKVIASVGHIRDLPSKDGAVLPNDNFKMSWEMHKDKEKVVKEIIGELKSADSLILATDPDREGEAISWHLKEILNSKKTIMQKPVERVVFNEITKNAVLDAMKKPREINTELVEAYLARRALDHLIGFSISPILWRKLPGSKSAGRVQSVALKLICEREIEIEKFNIEEYWSISSIFSKNNNENFSAKLFVLDSKKLAKMDLKSEDDANEALDKIRKSSFNISKIETKRVKRNPLAPFTTSTLQQEASNKLGFGASRTMRIAQKLYEGINIGSETTGLITYMRTDGVQLSSQAIDELRNEITNRHGKDYIPQTPRVYKSKAANAQEAHEAIRPTSISRDPENMSQYLDNEQLKLYELIWKRTISSQMQSAELDETAADISNKDMSIIFRANGSQVYFPGFFVYRDREDDKILPKLVENEDVDLEKADGEQHFTQPPPRFTDASLIKKMEELGIGRPSTYASILQVLINRSYVEKEKGKHIPQERGRILTAFLNNFFGQYIEYDFTADLEKKLDKVSDGKLNYKKLLEEFWDGFKPHLNKMSELERDKILEALENELSDLFFPKEDLTKNGEPNKKCPTCSNGKLGLELGKYGAFIGCSNYPECKFTKQIASNQNEENDANSTFMPNDDGILGIDPESGLNAIIKKGPYGIYLQLGDEKKPKRTSIPKLVEAKGIDLQKALAFLSLPRLIGKHPETGQDISAGIGRYGPYLKYDINFISIPADETVINIGLNHAVVLIGENSEKLGKVLGDHPDGNGKVLAKSGRFGPYVEYNKIRATLPKSISLEEISLDQAIELIIAKAAKPPRTKKKTVKKK
ncbi:MAG: type I DNA topoisomerase [Candidatus Puniceispirillales bacterium]|tara:strand:+ start:3835 stop:6345 length:2511 start_codon:yes stop_codon:yes gene_type:complete